MKPCTTRCALLVTPICLGWVGLALVAPGVLGGEKIQFSSPKGEMDLPAKRDADLDLPSTTKWRPANPLDEMPPPPLPIMPINPQFQKKLNDLREERKTWLFNEPEVFKVKDKFTDPFKASADPRNEAWKDFDSRTERVLGKSPLPASLANPIAGSLDSRSDLDRRRRGALYSDAPLFDTKKPVGADAFDLNEREKNDRDKTKNQASASVKALFDPNAASDKLPVQPGMSLYEMFGAGKAVSLKREEEANRKAFTQLLGGSALARPPTLPALADPINSQNDLTRTPVNPVLPAMPGGLPVVRGPKDPLVQPGQIDRPSRPLPFEDPVRVQAAAAAARPVDKSRQMEALKLMNRPAVFEFPGRRF